MYKSEYTWVSVPVKIHTVQILVQYFCILNPTVWLRNHWERSRKQISLGRCLQKNHLFGRGSSSITTEDFFSVLNLDTNYSFMFLVWRQLSVWNVAAPRAVRDVTFIYEREQFVYIISLPRRVFASTLLDAARNGRNDTRAVSLHPDTCSRAYVGVVADVSTLVVFEAGVFYDIRHKGTLMKGFRCRYKWYLGN